MFCKYCGTKLENGVKFCPNCGAKVEEESNAGASGSERIVFTQEPATSALPMKWYKFLVTAGLFIYAVLTGIGAIGNLLNGLFFGSALTIYEVVSVILDLGLAAFAIYVRQRLFDYRKDAPFMFCVLLGVDSLVDILYSVCEFLFYPEMLEELLNESLGEYSGFVYTTVTAYFITSTVISVAIAGVIIALNFIYFQKRKDLFTR